MPATERAFTEIPPAHLYFDTNILLDYLVIDRHHHQRADRLIQHLLAHGFTTLYLAAIVWTELAHVVTRQDFRTALPMDWQQQYRLAEWEQPGVRLAYLSAWLALLEQLLSPFDWVEVAVTPAVRVRALDHMLQLNLQATDAIHLACAESVGVVDFASFDRGFRRVDGLYLWNDCIYSPKLP